MNFYQEVYYWTKKIPKGRVATYGQIAALCGNPRAARQVGWALHVAPDLRILPWYRVINSKGYITTTCPDHPADMQKQLLEREGIEVIRKNNMWWVDFSLFLWHM